MKYKGYRRTKCNTRSVRHTTPACRMMCIIIIITLYNLYIYYDDPSAEYADNTKCTITLCLRPRYVICVATMRADI